MTIVVYPEPDFAHLLRLSDDVGTLEHARGSVPLREHGYCVDDATRALIVICREPAPSPALIRLAGTLLALIVHAEDPSGSFHNRLSYDRRWTDSAETNDWWGRALMALGTAAAQAPATWMRQAALVAFERASHQRSAAPRAMAFAGLGAAELLTARPEHGGARQLLIDATTTVGRGQASTAWPWPEPRLAYANAALAEVHLAAGAILNDDRSTAVGHRLLSWLIDQESRDGHLSVTPVGGWGPGEPRPGFDQQPIEVAVLADACARAAASSEDPQWIETLRLAVDWFLGDNDAKVSMMDTETGGGADGLRADGCSLNQGAESTLALLSTLQHGRRLNGGTRGR